MTRQSTQAYESLIAIHLPRSDISAIADTVRKNGRLQPGDLLEAVVNKLGGELESRAHPRGFGRQTPGRFADVGVGAAGTGRT